MYSDITACQKSLGCLFDKMGFPVVLFVLALVAYLP